MASRVTQVAIEVVVTPTSEAARVTQMALEVVVLPSSQIARLTQLGYEWLIAPPPSPESFGMLRGLVTFPLIAGSPIARSRRVPFVAGVADFVLDPSEVADLVMLYAFRGFGIGNGNVTWAMVSPANPSGTFAVVSDDEEVALFFDRANPPSIRFTRGAGTAAAVEVHMVLFSRSELEKMRSWLRLPPTGLPPGS